MELAFLHADACGYTAAMATSPEGTLRRLMAGQRIFRQASKLFGGRTVDMAGDSVLLAFDSAEAAFHAACHALGSILAASPRENHSRPLDYKIGIACGRVVVHGSAVYGPCINTAARIGSLVGRNGLGVEKSIWPRIGALAHGFVVKEQMLFAKPDEPMLSFVEVSRTAGNEKAASVSGPGVNEPVIVIVPQVGGAGGRMARQARDVIDALIWNCASYFSTYGWRSAWHDPESAAAGTDGSEGDYILRCSATGVASGVRIFASVASRYLPHGAQHFSRDAEDFDGAIASTSALASLVGTAISQAEIERAAQSRRAGSHQFVAAARVAIDGFSKDQFARGMQYLEAALRLDPEYPLLLSTLARAYTVGWRFGWHDGNVDLLGEARDYASRALRLSPMDARCEADLGFVKFWANEPDEAAWHYERAIDTLPYHPELSADAGMSFSFVGDFDKAASVLERSIANLPLQADYRLWSLGDVYFARRDYGSSLKWLSRMSDQTQAHRLMAANKARLGLDASMHVRKVLAQQPDFSVNRWVDLQPFTRDEEREDFLEALLLAGLPP